jgi:hypothetical protein
MPLCLPCSVGGLRGDPCGICEAARAGHCVVGAGTGALPLRGLRGLHGENLWDIGA